MTFGFWGKGFSGSTGGYGRDGYDAKGDDCDDDKGGKGGKSRDDDKGGKGGKDDDKGGKGGKDDDKGGKDYDKGGKDGKDDDDKGGRGGKDYDKGGKDDDDKGGKGGKDYDKGGKGGKDDDKGGKDGKDDDKGGKGGKDDDKGGKGDDHHGGGKDDDSCDGDSGGDTPPPPPIDDIPCKTATFVIEGDIATQITLTELADGSIRVDVAEVPGDIIGDLRGVFFDINDESKLSGMTVTGADVGASVFDANSVKSVANGSNIKGEVLNTYGAFDGGVEIGTSGIGKDDVRETSFVLSSASGPLTLEDFTGADFALRYTSVGSETGGGACGDGRGDSLKIGGNAGDLGAHCTTASIGDRVWLDANKDGIQNDGELGLSGVTVALLKDGVLTGASVLTGADGSYLFDGLAAGDYSIKVTETAGFYAFAGQNALGSTEADDSDVDATGLSDTFALSEGENRTDLDAGLVELTPVVIYGSLGDTIWLDTNGNGVQDQGETGVAGVTVELIANGVATGQTITTGTDGSYLFTDLLAGDYAVQVTGVAAGYEFTAQNAAAGTEAIDSDVNAAGLSDTVTLAAGDNYFDLDAGITLATPNVGNDMSGTCADEVKTLDVLVNDDAGLTINAVNGTAVAEGGSVTLASGAIVTLTAGALVYDGIAAWAGLSFMQTASDAFTYTATTAQGGEATANVDMMIAGNPAVDLAEIALSLTGTVDFTITDLLSAGNGFTIDTVSSDNVRLDVTGVAAFCVDFSGQVLPGATLTAEVFVADANNAALANYVVNLENLDLVNYVLNQDYASLGYSNNDIQDAIWFLTDDLPTLGMQNVLNIVIDAYTFGEGFEAGSGDVVGLLLAPIQEVDANGLETSNFQNFIYGVEFDILADCLM
jgi:hypothetical protein